LNVPGNLRGVVLKHFEAKITQMNDEIWFGTMSLQLFFWGGSSMMGDAYLISENPD